MAADGDDVGRKIEFFVVTNQMEMLSEFFCNFQSAMFWLSEKLEDEFDAKIIFNGGDNLLADLKIDGKQIEELENLRVEFSRRSKATLSFGVGINPRQAYFALKLAKASGKDRIEIFQECING
ncbi:MAG: mCpol domain-containing protein [Leptolyngbyaceae cyanobacterium SL_7_1]|nr:mCpol domain-containing protein [Leptolyngbyaceae cyanobacterium SL_7_1]